MLANAVRAALAGALMLGVVGVGLVAANRMLTVVRVTGESMHPALHAGDVVVVRRTGDVDTGDVVLYRAPEHRSAVLHRVIGRKRGALITRGDAKPVADFGSLAPSCVTGRAVAVLPFGGLLERWRGPGGGDTLHNQSQSARR